MKKNLIWIFIVIAAVTPLFEYSAIKSVEAAVTLEVLNPRAAIKPLPTLAPTPRVTDLAGKKIGIYWNYKPGGNNFWNVIEELLKEKIPTATILRYEGPFIPGDDLAAKMVKECDTIVYGVGD
jgi:hypothetical protein